MRKIFFFIAIAFMAVQISCKNASSEKKQSNPAENNDNTAANPANNQSEGGLLIIKNDCATCHNATAKIVGPSYADIAAKYPENDANISKLSDAIINGGSGSWGSVPMPSHPGLSKQDAGKMVGYILSMNNKK